MSITITIKNESLQGTQPSWQLEINEEYSTLRDIIRSRIYQDVSEYNARKRVQSLCLIPPTSCQSEAEDMPTLDWQTQYTQAIKAFEKRSYIVIVDNKQVTQLDSPVQLTIESTVTFFKLVPLIGG
ncbi:hypothetical protein ccbrp13_35860 [Ktedonobacteria bacterium brp13]|nr:hypothetical protein ccbrp13_35860 [Ktedonobacteria bacterium brp13]